jgi:hypothetical protein
VSQPREDRDVEAGGDGSAVARQDADGQASRKLFRAARRGGHNADIPPAGQDDEARPGQQLAEPLGEKNIPGARAVACAHDAGDRAAGGHSGDGSPGGVAHEWRGPNPLVSPDLPRLFWMSSATIAMAISSGDSAPMSRPTGLLIRANSSSRHPSRRRSS